MKALLAALILLVAAPAAANNTAAEAAIFRACADRAQAEGDTETAELFMSAVKGGTVLPKRKPSRAMCLSMRSAAEMYAPMLKPKER
jgi:hypothetical protein